MKILAIGNSFSQDATRYLQEIAASAGEELFVRNLYIGGCSLEMHANNIKANAPAYDYESGRSGKPETYEPYMAYIIQTIKDACPKAEILLHRTWAYEIGSGHGNFPAYNRSQLEMYGAIVAATNEYAAKYKLRIIPVGDFIQLLRNTPPFDFKSGGMTLCRDNFHLSLDYGRYAAALCWFKFFTGRSAMDVTFVPENVYMSCINAIKKAADLYL